MAILLDSSIFCAYANSNDVFNEKAQKIVEDIVSNKYGAPITTDYVFDETVTVMLRRSGIKSAAEIGNFILKSEINVAKIIEPVFARAWGIFVSENNLSFTDCTLIAFAEIFGIDKIATFDKEFKKHAKYFSVIG